MTSPQRTEHRWIDVPGHGTSAELRATTKLTFPKRCVFNTSHRSFHCADQTSCTRAVQVSSRSSKRTVTVSPACFAITLRSSVLMGSLCVPSPIAMNELRKG